MKPNIQSKLHGRRRKVVLVPQELVVLDDTPNQVEKRLVLQPRRDGVDASPGKVSVALPKTRAAYLVMFS
jgi:hypothetical protein